MQKLDYNKVMYLEFDINYIRSMCERNIPIGTGDMDELEEYFGKFIKAYVSAYAKDKDVYVTEKDILSACRYSIRSNHDRLRVPASYSPFWGNQVTNYDVYSVTDVMDKVLREAMTANEKEYYRKNLVAFIDAIQKYIIADLNSRNEHLVVIDGIHGLSSLYKENWSVGSKIIIYWHKQQL